MKRYVRKGVPGEHRAHIWMAASGAQEQLESNPGYYRDLLASEHDARLTETIRAGGTSVVTEYVTGVAMMAVLFTSPPGILRKLGRCVKCALKQNRVI